MVPLLLANPGGWGRSTRHAEAIELLTRVHGTGELPFSLTVLLVCTCRRWDRVTAKLIAGIHDSELLHDDELDELANALLAQNHVIPYPLASASPQWLEIDLHDGNGRTYTITEDAPARRHLRPEPPLRRWAARHALHNRPQRLAELLEEPARRTLIDRALRAAHGSVRIAALDLLCDLDGPNPARRFAASDPNAQVRQWRPPTDTTTPSLFAT